VGIVQRIANEQLGVNGYDHHKKNSLTCFLNMLKAMNERLSANSRSFSTNERT